MKQSRRGQDMEIKGAGSLSEGNRLLATGEFYWTCSPTFGPYVEQLRKSAKLSLRAAAERLGLSFSNLYKLERGVRQKPPSLKLLADIAALYSRPYEEVMREAGIEVKLPEGVHKETDYEREFEALVLHPAFKPLEMDLDWCTAFVFLQKQQWVEFAMKLEALVEKRGRCVGEIIKAGPPEFYRDASGKRHSLVELRTPVRQARFDYVVLARYPWRFREEFGGYLRDLRNHAGLSLREAASKLGEPFSMLQRWETGTRVRPSLALLRNVAHVYDAHLEEVMEAAGFQIDERSDLAGLEVPDLACAALVFHKALLPVGMNAKWFKSYSELQRQQWIELAYRLEDHVLQGGAKIEEITARYQANLR